MEDGLREVTPRVAKQMDALVLILVVMEDGLREQRLLSNVPSSKVLILVVMEDGLRVE